MKSTFNLNGGSYKNDFLQLVQSVLDVPKYFLHKGVTHLSISMTRILINATARPFLTTFIALDKYPIKL